MSVLPAQAIRAVKPQIITPFHERSVHGRMTYGLGPAGYDVRVAEGWTFRQGGRCFALASTIERFNIPADVIAYVKDKSTWARRGLCVQNTVIEPGWHGYLTLELTYHGDDMVIVNSGDPIAQIVFHRLEAATEQPYSGKYQDQKAGPQPALDEPSKGVRRHSWGEPVRTTYRTERRCVNCGMVKVTRHDGDRYPWAEFERDGKRVGAMYTPPCEGGLPCLRP